MTTLKNQYENQRAKLEIIGAFVTKYGDQLGEHGFIGSDSTTVHLFGSPHERDRNARLTMASRVFGPDGWIRQLNNNRDSFNWIKAFDGVTVCLYEIESIDNPMNNTPVAPKMFPLALTDANEA